MGGVELILILLFVSVAGLNALAHWLLVPYPILPGARRPRPGVRPRSTGGPSRSGPGPDPLPAAASLLGRLLHRSALTSRQRPAAVADRDRAGAVDHGDRRGDRPRDDRDDLGGRLRARRDRLAGPTRWRGPRSCAGSERRGGSSTWSRGRASSNDASALVAYRVAVAAAVGGSFSPLDASLEFVGAAAGGVAIGWSSATSLPRSGAGSRTDDRDHDLAVHRLRRLPAGEWNPASPPGCWPR